MSREIKFRAWIKDIDGDEEFGYVPPTTIQEMIHSKKSTFSLKQLNDLVEFEQFTGLKDKNGKDIYEGDILAWHSNVYRKHDWVGIVVYRGAGFTVQDSDKSYSSSEWLECACQKDANIVEIVGNVHEDGQLLEADK